jgi:DEAD/DEAH box helicase domain-containing protein
LDAFYEKSGWTVVHRHSQPGRPAQRFSIEGLNVSQSTRQYIETAFSQGVYRHQSEAFSQFISGENVCLTTGTASGKSALFFFAGIEVLAREPHSTVLAIYPMKALGVEQESRWKAALETSGLDVLIGRIDGSVRQEARNRILRDCRVVIVTPDVLHAWFLFHLEDASIRRFLRNLRLMVVDEVHSYTGVFGSNAAFLFRRLAHVVEQLGGHYRYVCASATIREPHQHLVKLFGVPFSLVGPEMDSSPKHPVYIEMVNVSGTTDFLSEVSALLRYLSTETSNRFIAFVDSRKQTEMISSILARGESGEEQLDQQEFFDPLERLDILPYRAGYEEHDRDVIQRRLTKGRVRGVVSTSALELGMDIPDLDVAVLVGVPASSTSFYQRIGRIGRHRPGRVIVINSGSVYDSAVFRHPEQLINRPLAESALYLENRRIQYIHALCLARIGGEHDLANSHRDTESTPITLSNRIDWPDGFAELCHQERIGQVPRDLQTMKMEAGDQPNHVFPLRDVETQFKVQLVQGPHREPLGSLSHAQVLREAYPGAVYYYATRPYRVYRILMNQRMIQVRPESRYFTTPMQRPTVVYPSFGEETVYNALRFGRVIGIESDLQIDESVIGVKERRGPKELSAQYPFTQQSGLSGVYYDRNRFNRLYFTTGVVLSHPAFNLEGVQVEVLANLLYEAFFMVVPFERRDVGIAIDKHRMDIVDITKGSRFICLYDQTYGSLRLSGRLLEDGVFTKVVRQMMELAEVSTDTEITPSTMEALRALVVDATAKPEPYSMFSESNASHSENGTRKRVIKPGSRGIALHSENELFEVERVFFSPKHGKLAYKGRYLDRSADGGVAVIWPIDAIEEIPGVTEFAWYDEETGDLLEEVSV